MNQKDIASDFLVVSPSFMRGLGRTLDLVGSLNAYNLSASPNAADALAMHADWSSVGADLARAMERFAPPPVCK
jgi:hypothetical protein